MVEPLPPITRRRFIAVFWIAAFASLSIWQFGGGDREGTSGGGLSSVFRWKTTTAAASGGFPLVRPVSFNLTDFGAVGDGVTINTEAFERAVSAISKLF